MKLNNNKQKKRIAEKAMVEVMPSSPLYHLSNESVMVSNFEDMTTTAGTSIFLESDFMMARDSSFDETPMKLFCERCKICRFGQSPMKDGIPPCSLFPNKFNTLKSFRFWHSKGVYPKRFFLHRSMDFKFLRWPRSWGIGPLRLFLYKNIACVLFRLPSLEGIAPLRP